MAPVSFGLSDRPLGAGGGYEPVAQVDAAINAAIEPQGCYLEHYDGLSFPDSRSIYVPVVDRHSVPLLTVIIDFENATVPTGGFDFIAAAQQEGR